MKFTNEIQVNDFLNTARSCVGQVWLESHNGDRLSLNSIFSSYLAMAALLTEHGEELELFCQLPEDKAKFYRYFDEHPGVN